MPSVCCRFTTLNTGPEKVTGVNGCEYKLCTVYVLCVCHYMNTVVTAHLTTHTL